MDNLNVCLKATPIFSMRTELRGCWATSKILLEGIVAKPQTRISDLPLLSKSERYQLLIEWNDTRSDYPSQSSVQALFEEQARTTPTATALMFGAETISYTELNRRANQMAHYLMDQGVGAESRVGNLSRSLARADYWRVGHSEGGGAYVPLDPGLSLCAAQFHAGRRRSHLSIN